MNRDLTVKITKTVSFSFDSLVNNPFVKTLKPNLKVKDACWELFLSGCELEVVTDRGSQETWNFLEKYDFPHMKVVKK